MKTEAVVLRTHGGPEVLVRETLDLPEPGPREVRVRVRAVALDHLDVWVRKGLPNLKLAYPHRLGSDIVGELDALGPGARTSFKVGERVVVSPGTSCGVCERCLSGEDNLCRQYAILGEHVSGGYSRHVVVPDANLLPYPGDMPFTQAAAVPARVSHGLADGRDQGSRAPGHDRAGAGGGQRRVERRDPDREALRRARHRHHGHRREGRAREGPRGRPRHQLRHAGLRRRDQAADGQARRRRRRRSRRRRRARPQRPGRDLGRARRDLRRHRGLRGEGRSAPRVLPSESSSWARPWARRARCSSSWSTC